MTITSKSRSVAMSIHLQPTYASRKYAQSYTRQ
jgi:hypothetical protein